MKKPELATNNAGGLDLIVERDAGNPVRILTGKNSLKFFKELKDLCEGAINTLEPPVETPLPKKVFKVVWEIELEETSPLAAAKEAQKWLQSKGDDWQYYVQERGNDKPIFSVDLQESDEDAVIQVSKEDYQPTIKG